ncbi:MAG TPA: TonB family protein, partial [Thermoanaerobaculia bacterium]|nr:TonB family protein [Thermoanaerobaculia bacterium]
AALVDPRSLTGPAYAQAPRAVRPRPAATPAQAVPGAPPAQQQQVAPQPVRRASMRTRPVPQYQPLPEIRARGTARLSLLIGADGRVREVDVTQPLRGGTADLVRAVQSWRFKPATENGEPVAAPYTVEISFR